MEGKSLTDIVAANITALRKEHKMTQLALAEQLNYSDKAVSKWERGESLPELAALKEIARIMGVTVDYLLSEDHRDYTDTHQQYTTHQKRNRLIISLISVMLVWFIATFVYINFSAFSLPNFAQWLVFVCAVPVSSIVALVFNSIWGKRRYNFLIISILVWSVLVTFYLIAHNYSLDLWRVFYLGVPAQIIIILWSRIKK